MSSDNYWFFMITFMSDRILVVFFWAPKQTYRDIFMFICNIEMDRLIAIPQFLFYLPCFTFLFANHFHFQHLFFFLKFFQLFPECRRCLYVLCFLWSCIINTDSNLIYIIQFRRNKLIFLAVNFLLVSISCFCAVGSC